MGLQLGMSHSIATECAAELLTLTLLEVLIMLNVLELDMAALACEEGLAKFVDEEPIGSPARTVVGSAAWA